MKRFFLISLVTLAVGASAPALANNYGVEGGVKFFNNNVPAEASKTFFAGGVFGEWALSDMFTFRPEILYVTSGPDYLQVPLMVQYKFDFGPLKPFVFLGPDVSFRVSSGGVTVGLSPYSTVNVAIDGGVGADYWLMPNLAVGVNWRYSFGLTNLAANQIAGATAVHDRSMFLLGAISYKF